MLFTKNKTIAVALDVVENKVRAFLDSNRS